MDHPEHEKGVADVNVGFRLPEDLVRRIDAHAARLEARTPGVRFNRTAALKALLTRALNEEESESIVVVAEEASAPAPKPRKPRRS